MNRKNTDGPTIDLAAELAIAERAVRKASIVCQRVRATLIGADARQKEDRSPVTVADYASQALVCAELSARSAIHAVVGEETADELRLPESAAMKDKVVELFRAARGELVSAEEVLDFIDMGGVDPLLNRPLRDIGGGPARDCYWTLDPIDGTQGFLRGEHYAIALALIEEGRVVLGVLGCPALEYRPGVPGVLMSAVKDRGAFAKPLFDDNDSDNNNDRVDSTAVRIRVGDIADAACARFCESVEAAHSAHDHAAQIASHLGITRAPLRLDSQAKYACVARGDASIYLRLPTRKDYREKIWDHAAGLLIVEEAGGQVSDIHGAALDFTHGRQLSENRGIVATNRAIHRQVLDAVRAVMGGREGE